MEIQPKQIINYVTNKGKIPFEDWLNSLRDLQAKTKIKTRLRRLMIGNLGDCKSLGDGVYELRIDYGKGYRLYFGQIGSIIIILLCGGDKSTQQKDIENAKQYWLDYKRSKNNGKS